MDVREAALDEIAVVVVDGHLPHFFAGGFRAGKEFVRESLVGAEDADVNVGEGDDDGASQRGSVDEVRGAELLGVVNAIGKDEAALCISVEDFDGFAGHGGLDVAGLLGGAAGHVFGGWHNTDHFDTGLESGESAHDAKHGGATGHVVLHFFHAIGGLDRDATSVEGDGFANEADHGCAWFRIGGRITNDHHAGRLRTTLGDTQERTHLEVGDFLFVEDFHGETGFFGHSSGFFGEDARREFVGWLIDEVAREVLRLGYDSAVRKTFVSRSAFRVGEASDQNCFDVFVVLLVGLVFVGFEIGGQRPFGDGLGGFFAGVALTNEQSEILDRASLQVPKRGTGDLAKRRVIPLLALPCSNEKQSCGLEAGGRVDQSELQHLAGQLAALSKLAQEAGGRLVNLRDAALNGISLLEYVGNQSISFECGERLGYERDLHGALSPPIAIHGLFHFTSSFLGAFVLAAVPRLLALRQGDFDLGDAVAKVNLQGDDGQTLGLGAAGKLVDLPLVKEELARA